MQFCHWCSKKIKQGRFCGVECLQAASEMPELINNKYLETPTKLRSPRRIALGVIGALALVGGSIAALWPAPASVATTVAPSYTCVMRPSTPEPVVTHIDTQVKAPVSAFIFTNSTIARTSEIDAMVQSTLPQLQALYGDMMLDTNNGAAPAGLLELSFLIQQDGSVKWVSRVGNSFSPMLDSVAIKGLQQLHFHESPVLGYTTLTDLPTPVLGEVEVKVMYRFGSDPETFTQKTTYQFDDGAMPYFEAVTR